MDRIIQMIFNRLLGRIVKLAVNRSVNYVAGPAKPRSEMSAAEREQAQKAKETVKRARQAAKLARRIR